MQFEGHIKYTIKILREKADELEKLLDQKQYTNDKG